MAIYDIANKIIPIEVFTWSGAYSFVAKTSDIDSGNRLKFYIIDIRHLYFKSKTFNIVPLDREREEVNFYTKKLKFNRRIVALAMVCL